MPSKKLEGELLPLMQEFIDTKGEHGGNQYHAALMRFAIYLRGRGITDPRKITKEILEPYPDVLYSEAGLKDSTRQTYLWACKSWMEWLKKMGVIIINPWGDKDYPLFGRIKISIPKTKAVNPRELALVFETHRMRRNKIAPFWWHREGAILAMIYGWGMNPAEVVDVTVGQVDPRLDYVTFKTHRSQKRHLRNMPYSEEMKTVMRRYLNVRLPREKPGIDKLIIDITGEEVQAQSVTKHVLKLGKEAGVRLNSTRLRESGIQELLSSSLSIEEIASMLGISTTTALLHVKDDTSPHSEAAREVLDGMMKKLRQREIEYGNKYWRQTDASQEDQGSEGL